MTQLTDVNKGVVVGAGSTIRGLLAELAPTTICGTECSGLAHFMHVVPLFKKLQLLQYIGYNTHIHTTVKCVLLKLYCEKKQKKCSYLNTLYNRHKKKQHGRKC